MEKVLQGNKSPCYQPGPQVCAQRPSLGAWGAVPPPPPAVRQELPGGVHCMWPYMTDDSTGLYACVCVCITAVCAGICVSMCVLEVGG